MSKLCGESHRKRQNLSYKGELANEGRMRVLRPSCRMTKLRTDRCGLAPVGLVGELR